MRAAPSLSNFSKGLLSPLWEGRTDLPLYYQGCRKLTNMAVLPQGAAEKMPGTKFIAEVKDSTKTARLVAFAPHQESAYVLEFGDLSIRVYKNGARVESGGSPVEVVSPFAAADLFQLKFQQVGVDLYIVHPTYDPRKLAWSSDTSWTLSTPSWTGQTFTGSGNRPQAVSFFQGRLIFGKGTKVFGSKTFTYTTFSVGANPSDGWEFELGAKRNCYIQWIEGHTELIVGTLGGEIVLSGGGGAITPSNVFAREQTTYGSANIQGKLVKNMVFFIQRDKKTIREYFYFSDADAYQSADHSMLTDRDVFGGGVKEFAFQLTPDPIIWFACESGKLVGFTYAREFDAVGFHVHETEGDYESVSVIPGSEHDEVYVLVKRTIGGQTKRYVEKFASRFWSYHKDAFYVHSGVTWDGGGEKNVTGATAANPVVISCGAGDIPLDGERVRIAGCERMTDINNRAFTVANAAGTSFELLGEDGSAYSVAASGSWGTFEVITDEVTGLDHLEGEEVAVMTDGGTHGAKTVVSGAITLDLEAGVVHAGLPYTATVSPMKINASQYGGKQRARVFRATARFYKTVGVKAGPDPDKLSAITFREFSDPLGAAPAPFTGVKSVSVDMPFGDEAYLELVSDEPQPFTVLSINPEMEAYAQ